VQRNAGRNLSRPANGDFIKNSTMRQKNEGDPINEQCKPETTNVVTPAMRDKVKFSQEESSGTKTQFKDGIDWSSKSKKALSSEQESGNRLTSRKKITKKEIDDGTKGIEPYEVTDVQVEERKGSIKPIIKKRRKELIVDIGLANNSNQVPNKDYKKLEDSEDNSVNDVRYRKQKVKNKKSQGEHKKVNKLGLSPTGYSINPLNGDAKKQSIDLKSKNKKVTDEDIKKPAKEKLRRSKSQTKTAKKGKIKLNGIKEPKANKLIRSLKKSKGTFSDLNRNISNESSSNLISSRQDNDQSIEMRQYFSVNEKNKMEHLDELGDEDNVERTNKILSSSTKRHKNLSGDIINEEEHNKVTKEGISYIKGQPHVQYNSNKQVKSNVKLVKSVLKKRDVKAVQEKEVPDAEDKVAERKHSVSVRTLHRKADKNSVEVEGQDKARTHMKTLTFDLSESNDRPLVIKNSKILRSLLKANTKKVKVVRKPTTSNEMYEDKVNSSRESNNAKYKSKKKYLNRSASIDNTTFTKIQSILNKQQVDNLDSFNELLNDFYKAPKVSYANNAPRSIPEALRIVQGKDPRRSLSISGPVQSLYPSIAFGNSNRRSGRFCE
jgi:hypothetical protein